MAFIFHYTIISGERRKSAAACGASQAAAVDPLPGGV